MIQLSRELFNEGMGDEDNELSQKHMYLFKGELKWLKIFNG